MKKLSIFLFAAALVFTSCEKTTEPGGTAIQDMAGDWWVTYENSLEEYDVLFGTGTTMPSADTLENWSWGDVYGAGVTRLLTYNTNANDADSMYVYDQKNFWNYKGKVPVSYDALTFGKNDSIPNLGYDINMVIRSGKILKGAATTPSGQPADSIIFYVGYSDDGYGFTFFKVSGFRRSGFPLDDF